MGDTPPSATRPPRRIVADAREAASTLHSLRDLVRHAVSRLGAASAGFGHGTADAVGEAIWMVCWVLHLPVEGYADLDLRAGVGTPAHRHPRHRGVRVRVLALLVQRSELFFWHHATSFRGNPGHPGHRTCGGGPIVPHVAPLGLNA